MQSWSVRLRPDVSDFWPSPAWLRRFSRPVRLILRILFIPFFTFAALGYVLACLVFPYMMLKLGLSFSDGTPRAGWFIWAGWVIAVYGVLLAALVMGVVRSARMRVLDLPGLLHAALFVAGYVLAAWLIPGEIGREREDGNQAAQVAWAMRSITESDAVFAIYSQDWGLASPGGVSLVFAAWGDGHVVWSEDRVRGGAPYRCGEVAPEKFATFMSRMESDGVFADSDLAQPRWGPDAEFTTILLRSSDQRLKMESWHELYELSGQAVATSGGVSGLNGGRLEVLKKEPAEYLHYRMVWSEIRSAAFKLIPDSIAPVHGEALMKAGVISWRERSAVDAARP